MVLKIWDVYCTEENCSSQVHQGCGLLFIIDLLPIGHIFRKHHIFSRPLREKLLLIHLSTREQSSLYVIFFCGVWGSRKSWFRKTGGCFNTQLSDSQQTMSHQRHTLMAWKFGTITHQCFIFEYVSVKLGSLSVSDPGSGLGLEHGTLT